MKIACIGWGSLIWDPRKLDAEKNWREDGPILPLEYARVSEDKRLTLVICPGAKEVKTYWTMMNSTEIPKAKDSLAEREGCRSIRPIGCLERSSVPDGVIQESIYDWLLNSNCDAVIWTNLSSKFYEERVGKAPSLEDALRYLASLTGEGAKKAEEYVRKTPKNIRTNFRERFESSFGWHPIEKVDD